MVGKDIVQVSSFLNERFFLLFEVEIPLQVQIIAWNGILLFEVCDLPLDSSYFRIEPSKFLYD